jgi:hypothetical protein
MSDIQQLIDQANKRTASDRRKQFAKKSTDAQMLDHLTKVARIAVDAFFSDGRDCSVAMKELRSFLVIAERRAK